MVPIAEESPPLSKPLLKLMIGFTSAEHADQAKEKFFYHKRFSRHKNDARFPVCQNAAFLGCS